MLNDLYEHYARAVQQLGKTVYETEYVRDPDESLAEHIAVFVVRGKLEFEDPLVSEFLRNSDSGVRAHVIDFFGQSFETESAVPAAIHSRMQQWWSRRLEAGDVTELAAFGRWFAAKHEDPAWALAQLKEALQRTPNFDLAFLILERLTDLAESMPLDVMQVLHRLVTGASDIFDFTVDKEKVARILRAAIAAQADYTLT